MLSFFETEHTADNADMMVSAVVGAVGLLPTLDAVAAGKDIGLANKETLVMAGYLVMAEAAAMLAKDIEERGLNRVIVASCSPRTHEPLFQETLISAGLNKYLIEMANIRNQDAWVHASNPDRATEKAKDMVRMAVAKAFLLKPLQETDLEGAVPLQRLAVRR